VKLHKYKILTITSRKMKLSGFIELSRRKEEKRRADNTVVKILSGSNHLGDVRVKVKNI
jgi:hypothetical protein